MEKVVRNLDELQEEADSFITKRTPDPRSATLVTLSGELGAGKTAFIKAVALALGVEEVVNSPTFVLEKIYKLGSETSKWERMIHIDAYRLENGSDLAPLGFDELMRNPNNLVLVEWPEKVSNMLPEPTTRISFTVNDDNSRTIFYG